MPGVGGGEGVSYEGMCQGQAIALPKRRQARLTPHQAWKYGRPASPVRRGRGGNYKVYRPDVLQGGQDDVSTRFSRFLVCGGGNR